MKIPLLILVIVTGILSSGCASTRSQEENQESTFTYEFENLGMSQSEVFRAARNFLATSYGDTNQVLRVIDENDGVIIGRGISPWSFGLGTICSTNHDIRLVARDDRARLQFEIVHGVPATSRCAGWPWPTDSGYEKIVSDFNAFAAALEAELRGETSDSDFFNF